MVRVSTGRQSAIRRAFRFSTYTAVPVRDALSAPGVSSIPKSFAQFCSISEAVGAVFRLRAVRTSI